MRKINKRIKENEERLDKLTVAIRDLENALDNFEESQASLKELNKYYGSKEWINDKDAYEEGKIEKIKAGVLSEDSVWNLIEDVRMLAERMSEISNRMLNQNKEVEK